MRYISEDKSKQILKIMLRVGEVLFSILFLLLTFMDWIIHSTLGKISSLETSVLIILIIAYLDLNIFNYKHSKVQLTHPVSKIFVVITILLLTAEFIEGIGSHFGVSFPYHEILFTVTLFFFDLTITLWYIKIIRQIRDEKQSIQVQELHISDPR